MASRILHGTTSSKNAEKKLPSTLPRPSASKRSKSASGNGGDSSDGGGGGGGGGGVGESGGTSATGTDTTTISSRLPQSSSTSFFGRHKGKAKEKTSEKKSVIGASSSDPRHSATGTSLPPKKLGKAKTSSDLGTRLTAASTIPRGLAPGMGVTTKITAGGQDAVVSTQQPRLLRRRPSFTNSNEQQRNADPRTVDGALQQEASSSLAESVDYESEHEPEHEPEGPVSNTIFGITISEPGGTTYTPISRPDYSTPTEYQTSNSRMELYMSKRLPHKLSTQNLPPPSTLSNSSSARDNSSTSSRFTETPSPFSRISTPNTSTSLHSPQVPAPKLTPPRLRPIVSPTKSRPPVVRRKMPGGTPVEEYSSSSRGLSSVRENNREVSNQSSSSSSNSTIKASDLIDPKLGKAVLSGKLERDVQPAAPLRISSKRLPKPPSGTSSQKAADKVDAKVEPSVLVHRDGSLSRIASAGARSPPSRPSRIGAPRVASLEQGDSPVVQSNLSHVATSGHTRRESMERALTSPDRGESGSPRRWLSRSPPKEVASFLSPTKQQPQSKSRSSSKSRQTATVAVDVPRASSKRDPSPASTTSAARSRFGLFSRRIKSPEEAPQPTVRKGPAAGTGHEAYGKFGRPTRGRSGSVSSTGSREKSSSPATRAPAKSRQGSFASNDGARPNKDDFFEQRLKPVVISGGGTIKSNRNSQNGISASVYASSSAQSSVASISSSVLYDKKTNITSSESSASILSSAMSEKRTSRSLLPAPKITSKSDATAHRSLAHRRSQQKISQGEQPSSVRIPAPIDTHVAKAKPVLDSRDTMQSSVLGTGSIPTDDLSESHWLRSGSGRDKGKSRTKSPRRWNIFSRARSRSPKKAANATPIDTALPSTDSVPPVSVSIKDMPKTRFVGHYALMEDEGLSSTDDKDIDNVLKDIEDDLDLRDEDGAIITSPEEQPLEPRQPSMLLPSPPKLNAEFPRLEPPKVVEQAYPEEQPYLNEPLPPVTEVKRRPSRLQRVGRIPNQYTHRPNQASFSRPFDASGLPSLEGDRASPRLQQSPSRPKLRLQTDSLPQTTRVEQWRQATYATAPATNAFLHHLNGETEFMSFASERQSLQMSQSSSSGNTSFINAVAQRAQASRQQGDETTTTESDLGDYADDFDLDSPEGEELLNSFPNLDDVRRVSPGVSPNSRDAPRPESKQSNRSKKSVSPPLPDKPDHLSVPPHLHPATQPHNKSNSSEIFSDYNRASARQRRGSNSSSVSDSRYSSQTTISSSSHVSAIVASPVNQVTRAMARKTHSARDSLRFSALMTSRWLSFDRVLFSPVAEDILSLSIQAPRILILDGLANDDWSAYTALSYPNATVYNLSTTPKLRTPSPHGDEWANPPNHKLLPLPSTAHPFPFPKGFFAAVVVRFPPLLPQHHLNNVIAEARRVLRPGGYLEMALLDIDPVNLGSRTRKEVRRVKMQAQQRMPDAGLAPVGDATMKLLSRRGFEGLKSAILNVPVATTPDVEAIEGPGPLPFNEERVSDPDGANKPNRTLGDLLREAGDESGAGVAAQYPVAQTVSRVARWWWSRCYEGLASVDGSDERGTLLGLRGRGEEDSRSMWADPTVIEECEERGTNLRLVLAYAVKPMVIRRRTTSV